MEIADGAIDFMERSASAKKAFYAYVPYTLVHYPTLPSAEFKGLTGSGDWADCLAQMDHNVGRLLDSIERLGLRDDTIVVFTSDNGADTSTLHKRGSAGPWAGTMFTPMEGSNRVPFIIRWPGRIGADRETDAIVHEVDTFTTLLRFAGADIPQDRPIDGVDQRDLLQGNTGILSTGRLSDLLRREALRGEMAEFQITFRVADERHRSRSATGNTGRLQPLDKSEGEHGREPRR